MTATAMEGGDLTIDALGARGTYRTARFDTVFDVASEPFARISSVPSLFVDRTLQALRRATPLREDERIGALAKAGGLFAQATLGGLTPEEYQYAVARVGGVPISAVRRSTAALEHRLSHVLENVSNARPAGAAEKWSDPRTRAGSALWTRRGETFAVLSAGNHPGTHSLWPEALALGYRVAVRPSSREPFTPSRLIAALREAGFGDEHVAYLPTDHETGEGLLRRADFGMVYGGDTVVSRFADDSTVLPQGPGRSTILVTADVDWRDHLDYIVDSVSHDGGAGCVNTTALLIEGEASAAAAAEAVAERLAALPSLPPDDDRAVLPVQPASTAGALERYLGAHAAGVQPLLGGDGIADTLPDGSAVLRPAVHLVPTPDAEALGVELPFPCVWVAPWTPQHGASVLRNSLVVGALTGDTDLVDELAFDPTIGNLHLGGVPTYRMAPGIPHDGYLAEFLMRSTSVIRGDSVIRTEPSCAGSGAGAKTTRGIQGAEKL